MELSVCSQDGSITLSFIIPKNSTSEKCTITIKCAFQACREAGLEPIWLSTEECLKMEPTKKDVFIIDPFEGEAYDFLLSSASQCVRVLGPRCLLSCLHEKCPVPELPSPLHNMAMQDLVLTSTGFEPAEKIEIQQLVERMCGIYSNSFHEGVTHLVAKAVGSKKYCVAIEKETPVMTDDWVKSVWTSANEKDGHEVSAVNEEFFKYSCPIFKGIIVCVSQLPKAEKESLKQAIESNGGTYTPNLEMTTTSVLITGSSTGDKYKHAVQWRIPCVTPEWVHDCVEQSHYLSVEQYKLVNKKSSTPTKDKSRASLPAPDMSLCSTIMNDSMAGRRLINETTNSLDPDQSLFTRKRSITLDPKLVLGLNSLKDLNIQSEMKGDLFLDGCKIFASGFENSMNNKLRKIFNAGGATRFDSLTDSVSHVVIGKFVSDDINKIEKLNSRPFVVNAEWLTCCVKEGRQVDENEYLFCSKPEEIVNEMPPPSKHPIIVPPQINETNNETYIDVDNEIMFQYLDNNEKNNDTLTSKRESLDCSTLPDSQHPGILSGKSFTICGYAEDSNDQIGENINANGGILLEHTTPRKVDFAIIGVEGEGSVPSSYSNVVTYRYLEDCLETESIIPVQYFHLPFMFEDNCTILNGCVLAISTYKGNERQFIVHVINKLGAVYQDMFAKKDNISRGVKSSTHLLCPSTEGDKYNASKKWKVPAVTKDWLLMCATEGKKISESLFKVEDTDTNAIDAHNIVMQLFKKSENFNDTNENIIAQTPVNRNIKNLKKEHLVKSIHTPDAETIRRLYPTPGVGTGNESLDNMPTPDTPYGQTWYKNPSARMRKAFKRAIDDLPDDPVPLKKQCLPSDGTPMEVYYKKHFDKIKKLVDSREGEQPPIPKFPLHELNDDTEDMEDTTLQEMESLSMVENAAVLKPLDGVVIYVTRKLADQTQNLYEAIAKLGGDFRWSYEESVTHLIHQGKLNDTNKDYKLAKERGIYIVSPEWVWNCIDSNEKLEEDLFPHTYNPKMSLSLVTTKSSPSSVRRRRSKRNTQNAVEESSQLTENTLQNSVSEESADPNESDKGCVAKELEEIENLAAKTRRNSVQKNKSLSEKNKNSPIMAPPSSKPVSNTESESQGTAITWEDPQEREARAKLENALRGDTQDILANRNDTTVPIPEESCMCFVLSGMANEEKEYFSDIIISLGGTMCENQQSFDPLATHIITTKPSRSEKHLAAIASGKWLLYISFLQESVEKRQFVKEEDHEWGNKNAKSLPSLESSSLEFKLACAGHRWRLNFLRSGKMAFHNMNVIFYTSKERASSFTRLFEAGGGTVLSSADSRNMELTHCFVELKKAGKVDLALFASRQIPCLSPLFLNEYLVTDPAPDAMENCIPEYKKIVADLT